ncbi:retrovirus-related pol polyprotein from transposon TNT 1-94, partial [Tanacetum coccineum]
ESNMAAYAFAAVEEEDTHEPLTYQEAVSCEDSSKWKAAMEKEMDSLRKNKTWELVDHPAVRHTSIRVILALTACKDYELEQLDVKTAFLHGNFEEVIYMRQPPGYEQGNKVCLLKNYLYSLKQSPRQWYKRFDEYMLSNGFKRSSYDSKAGIGSTKSLFKKEFDMKELGEAKKILDNGKSVKMPLGGHFKLSLKDCPVKDCDVERMSKVPYANAVGGLMYLMVCTRPDIAYAVSFVDSDYAKDPDKGRSITGYTFLVHECVVSWKATLQHVVALSTTEARYMALTVAVKEAIWLRGLLEELGVELNIVAVNCDNRVLEAKTVKVLKVGTEHNVADALAKVVPGLKLQHCLELLNEALTLEDVMATLIKGNQEEGLRRSGNGWECQSGESLRVVNGSMGCFIWKCRRDNCVYSLDGHAMAGELNASVEEKDSLAQVWHKRLGHISEAGLQVLEKHRRYGVISSGLNMKHWKVQRGVDCFSRKSDWELYIESGIVDNWQFCRVAAQQIRVADVWNRNISWIGYAVY